MITAVSSFAGQCACCLISGVCIIFIIHIVPAHEIVCVGFADPQDLCNIPRRIGILLQLFARRLTGNFMVLHLTGVPVLKAFDHYPHFSVHKDGVEILLMDQPVGLNLLQSEETSHLPHSHGLFLRLVHVPTSDM